MSERISRDRLIWAFTPDLEPVLEVDPGTLVTFETVDCFDGQIRSEHDLVTAVDRGRINGATGPVAVRGAEPGDSIVAEIVAIRTEPWGVATLIPGVGQLSSAVESPLTRVFAIRDGIVAMGDRVSFPARPMVGIVGVAPADCAMPTRLAGPHGGNLDDRFHGVGSRIYLPVRRPGGLVAIGDLHASMGDGEICFTGVETPGEVDLRLELLKGKQATWPVTELSGCWIPHATADTFEGALARVAEEAAMLLMREWGFSPEDAFMFLSVACDAGIAQACSPARAPKVARFSIPKLDACPAPFA
ncbi:MAG TPA: acetamidase/formamidase family protein [Gaiellaceae bacterium]